MNDSIRPTMLTASLSGANRTRNSMSYEETEIPFLWPRLSMSCYHQSFLHKQLLNCIWIQQKSTNKMDYTNGTGTACKRSVRHNWETLQWCILFVSIFGHM